MDFNLNHYNYEDLLEILNLTENINKQKLKNNYYNIIDKINNDNSIDINEKYNFKNFIFNITKKICSLNNLDFNDLFQNNITQTFENKIIPHYLNPIKKVIRKINLNFDSIFRDNYLNSSPSNFNYTLPVPIKNVISINLSSIELINTWYTFEYKKNNNRFFVEMKNDCECNIYEIIIQDGNYTINEIINFLNNNYFKDNNKEEYKLLKFLEISVDNNNQKTTIGFIKDSPKNLKFTLIFMNDELNDIVNNFGWYLGFRLARYEDIKTSVTSESINNIIGEKYFYFSLEDYQSNKSITNNVYFNNTSMDESILSKVYLNNGFFQLNIFENNGFNGKTRNYFGPVNISKFRVKLLDRYGEIINLNNIDFSFTLEAEIIYNSDYSSKQ